MSNIILCPTCDFESPNRYCSRCGKDLWLQPSDFLTIAHKRFLRSGYIDFTNEGPTRLPWDLFTLLAPLNKVLPVLLVADHRYMRNRVLQIVALTQATDLADEALSSLESLHRTLIAGLGTLRTGRVTSSDLSVVASFEKDADPAALGRFQRFSQTRSGLGRPIAIKVVPVDIAEGTIGAGQADPMHRPLMLALQQVRRHQGQAAGSALSPAATTQRRFAADFGAPVVRLAD